MNTPTRDRSKGFSQRLKLIQYRARQSFLPETTDGGNDPGNIFKEYKLTKRGSE